MKTLIMDNFLSNPDNVREFGLSLSYRRIDINENWEGQRSEQVSVYDKTLADNICRGIISNYFNMTHFRYSADLFFHKTMKSDLNDKQWINDKIHTDKGMIASLIYLTPNAPINSGTQTYKDEQPDIVMGNRYNRMVCYPSDIPHSAMTYFGDENDCRLVLLFWLFKLEVSK